MTDQETFDAMQQGKRVYIVQPYAGHYDGQTFDIVSVGRGTADIVSNTGSLLSEIDTIKLEVVN